MTPLEIAPLVLWGVPLVVFGGIVLHEVGVEFQRRSWNRRADALIASVEARQAERAAEQILTDAELISVLQIEWLESCLALPCAVEPR